MFSKHQFTLKILDLLCREGVASFVLLLILELMLHYERGVFRGRAIAIANNIFFHCFEIGIELCHNFILSIFLCVSYL